MNKKEKLITEVGKELITLNNTREVIKCFLNNRPLFYDKSKMWWIWDKERLCWDRLDETDILKIVNFSTGMDTISSNSKSMIMEALKQEARQKVPKNIPLYWVQFKNRIINILENETITPSTNYFATNPIPWEIGKSSETPTMDRIFAEWVGEEYVKTLYEIIAYCTLPSYPIHRIFCFIGAGMNGKSKFLELVRKFIGIENCATTELDRLLESRFELTRLHKKSVCMMGETNFNEMKKTSILKSLSGGDLIGFEYKNKDPFQETNYAKILISTNNLPATTDKTIGFYRRWLIIDFPNIFNEKKDILSEIPDEEYNNLANKCVILLRALLLNREFTNEGSIDERMKKFEEKSNPFGKFFEKFCMESFGENDYIPKFEFKKRLDDWCKENNFRTLTDTSILTKMRELGVESAKFTMPWFTSDGIKPRYNCWNGIIWRKI